MIYLDITRLLSRLDAPSPTGIDRVELEYAKHFLARDAGFVVQSGDNLFQLPFWLAEAFVSQIDARWRSGAVVDEALLKAVDVVKRGAMPGARARSGIERFFDSLKGRSLRERWRLVAAERAYIKGMSKGVPVQVSIGAVALFPWLFERIFVPGAKTDKRTPSIYLSAVDEDHRYVNVGHSGLEKDEFYRNLKQGGGFHVSIYLHDILPISHPHLFVEGEDVKHRRRIDNVLKYADEVLVNSHFTKSELAKGFRYSGDMEVLEIGVSGVDAGRADRSANEGVERAGFVSVGTVEPRKNYLWLVRAWLAFCHKYPDLVGEERLVIYGKRGWLSDGQMAELDAVVAGSPHVEIASGVNDEGLAQALRGARAYLTAAEVEGWGMPLAESLSLGTPVIASDVPAHREVTQGCASYFEYNDADAFERELLRCFDQDGARHMAETVQAFRPWSWQCHFERFDRLLIDRP